MANSHLHDADATQLPGTVAIQQLSCVGVVGVNWTLIYTLLKRFRSHLVFLHAFGVELCQTQRNFAGIGLWDAFTVHSQSVNSKICFLWRRIEA